MLIRYLASGRYAAERDRPAIAIARVDFDHMSPDYPVRRPVSSCSSWPTNWRCTPPVSAGRTGRYRFRASAADVTIAEQHPRGTREPMQNPQVLAAIDDFATVLGQFPGVLLILDTCEELAKADWGTRRRPLSEHARDPRAHPARVVRPPRRPSGFCSPAAGRYPRASYLDVQEVAGFTLDEASAVPGGLCRRAAGGRAGRRDNQPVARRRRAHHRARRDPRPREPLRPGPVPAWADEDHALTSRAWPREATPTSRGGSSSGSATPDC